MNRIPNWLKWLVVALVFALMGAAVLAGLPGGYARPGQHLRHLPRGRRLTPDTQHKRRPAKSRAPFRAVFFRGRCPQSPRSAPFEAMTMPSILLLRYIQIRAIPLNPIIVSPKNKLLFDIAFKFSICY